MSSVISRVIGNVSLLVSSSGIAGVCAIIALSFNTRALGAHDFGVLSLIQAYVALVSSLTSFESWQPVVRLGIRMPSRLGVTLSSGILLDVGAACFAALAAIVGVLTFGSIFGISTENSGLAAIYSLSLLAGVAGTPKGYFRLRQDFKVLAGNQAALAIAMMVASVALWWIDARLSTYVVVFAIVAATYNASLLFRMLRSIKKQRTALVLPITTRVQRRHLKLMFKMATGTSVLSSLLASRRHLALFVVGHVFGEVAAGVYSVAAKLVTAVSKFTLLLNQVVFSEVMKGAHELELAAWRRVVFKVSVGAALISFGIGVSGVALRDILVHLVGGPEYMAAAPIFGFLFVAECVGLAAIHFNPVIQHRVGAPPLINYAAVSLAIFFGSAVVLSHRIGIDGAAIGVLISSVAAYLMMAVKAANLLKRTPVRHSST